MIQMTLLRIDATIKPSSYLRLLIYGSLTGAMILLGWLATLLLWQYVLLLMISVAVFSYLVLSRPIPLHLSQPPLSQRVDHNWQLLMRTGRGDGLWQAELAAVHHYHWLITFEFIIVEPYQRSLSVTVFRDQVSAEDWRKLSILASLISTKTI